MTADHSTLKYNNNNYNNENTNVALNSVSIIFSRKQLRDEHWGQVGLEVNSSEM
jgi:hypothetical protein